MSRHFWVYLFLSIIYLCGGYFKCSSEGCLSDWLPYWLSIFCQAVVIEEISEDEKPSNRELRDRANVGSQSQIVKYHRSPTVESEDEDGFPVSMANKTDGKNASGHKKLDSKLPNADQKR